MIGYESSGSGTIRPGYRRHCGLELPCTHIPSDGLTWIQTSKLEYLHFENPVISHILCTDKKAKNLRELWNAPPARKPS